MNHLAVFCLLVAVIAPGLLLPLPETCDFFGTQHEVGSSWGSNCTAWCTCHAADSFGCVSMCPPVQAGPGCEFVDNPDRNVENSTNCCKKLQCLPDCIDEDVGYTIGDTWKKGCDSNCSCRADGIACDPLCPLVLVPPGCALIDNPLKDVANHENCCGELRCELHPPCMVDGVAIPSGAKHEFEDKVCFCFEGTEFCF